MLSVLARWGGATVIDVRSLVSRVSIARTPSRAAIVLVAVLLLGSTGTAVARVPSAVECLALASDLPGTTTRQPPAAWVAALPGSVRRAARGRAAQELLVGIGSSRA